MPRATATLAENASPQARRLFSVMRKHNLTVKGWTTRAGKQPNTLRNLFRGKSSTLDTDTLLSLARCVDLTLTELLGTESGSVPEIREEMSTAERIIDLLRELVKTQRALPAK